MKLLLRNNGLKDNWLPIDLKDGEPFKLLLDYPMPEQEQRFQTVSNGLEYWGEDKKNKIFL